MAIELKQVKQLLVHAYHLDGTDKIGIFFRALLEVENSIVLSKCECSKFKT